MSLLVSSVPGRLRARHPSTRPPASLAAIARRLRTLTGVVEVRPNQTARSLVVVYDPQVTRQWQMEEGVRDALTEALPTLDRQHLQGTPEPLVRRFNRYSKVGAAGALGTSIALALVGSRRWHAWTGWAAVGLLGVHLYVHRKRLFA